MNLGGKRNPFPAELSLGCATLICLFSYQTLFSGTRPTPKQPVNPAFFFPLLVFQLTTIFLYLHLLFSTSFCWQSYTFICFFCFLQPPLGLFSGLPVGWKGCGFRPGPPGFHSNTLCPDVISIDDVQLGQAVLAQGAFAVYHGPFSNCACVSILDSDRGKNQHQKICDCLMKKHTG